MPTTRTREVRFADDLEGMEQLIPQLASCDLDVLGSIPNVFERVRLLTEQDRDDPRAMTSEEISEVLAFCQYHDINAAEAAALATASPHEVREKRGFWQRILLLLRNYDEGDPERPQAGPIPIAEIHVPGVAGCECKYVQETETSQKLGLTLKIRGVGCGGGKEAVVKFASEIVSPVCGQITIPGKYQVTPWTNPDYGSRIDFVTFTEFEADSLGLHAIPPYRSHLCSQGISASLAELRAKNAEYKTHTIEIPGGTLSPLQKVETTRELKLVFDNILEITSRFDKGFAYGWKIMGPANYLRFYENKRSNVQFWNWETVDV
jgi:hypothetical protein